VILTSDHGFSTISKETATSYVAAQSYKDVPAALLPPGFVAIDLAHGLRMSLFDPDAKNGPVVAGSFPTRANGLIGDDPAHPYVVVAANGGSDLIYLPVPDKVLTAHVIQILAAQDYVSGLFVDSRLGSIPGTLPLAAIALEGTALTPTPAIVVNFRTFSLGCADPTTCGVAVADTILQQGQGIGGSFSRADTRNVMGAAGPGIPDGVSGSGAGKQRRYRQDHSLASGPQEQGEGHPGGSRAERGNAERRHGWVSAFGDAVRAGRYRTGNDGEISDDWTDALFRCRGIPGADARIGLIGPRLDG
jgi:hypothetical protein